MRQQLVDQLDADRDRIIELVQQMIRIPSENPPGDTTDLCAFVVDYLGRHGVDYEIVAPEPTMPNIIAHVDGSGPGKHLVLNGHLDVFPAGDAGAWTDDPFSGVVRDGKLYGRGANDMKAGTAASILAFLYLSERRDQWRGRLTLTIVSDEETFGPYGARHLVENRPDVLGDALLSGEPSTPYFVRYAEKGPLWIELTVQTPGGHGGYPQISPNAILVAGDVLQDLQALNEIEIRAPADVLASVEASRERLEETFGPGTVDALTHVTVNTGVISGGDKVNMIAAKCRVEVDIRTPVGVTTDEVLERVDKIVAHHEGVSYRIINRAESNACVPDHELVEIIQNNAEATRGIRPLPSLGLGGTDCRLWRYRGIPAYVYGPTPYAMGAPNEHVLIDDLLATVHVHTLSAFDYLSGP
ncbi:M20 family metallopeptidase [soil metagenome]